MSVSSLFIVTALLFSTVLPAQVSPQQLPPDDPLAPPVNVPTYEEWKKHNKPVAPEPIGERSNMARRLPFFKVGAYTHPNGFSFCEQIKADIDVAIMKGQRLSRIVVIGSADGTPNHGLTIALHDLPDTCQTAVTIPINDHDLAMLRGCVIREELAKLLKDNVSADLTWQQDEFDEPDGGEQTGQLRSVEVRVYLEKKP